MSEQGLYLDPEDFLKSKVSQNPKLSATCEVSLGQLVIAENWISNFSLMATSLYVLFNNNNSDLIVWEERHNTAFKGLKQSLMNSSAFGLPMIRLFFFFIFVYEGKGISLGYSPQNTIDPQHITDQQLDLVSQGHPPLSQNHYNHCPFG